MKSTFYVITCTKCDQEWPRDEKKSQEANRPIPAERCSCGADESHRNIKAIVI